MEPNKSGGKEAKGKENSGAKGKQDARGADEKKCSRCEGPHMTWDCNYDGVCHHCHKKGHKIAVCRDKRDGKPAKAKSKARLAVQDNSADSESTVEESD